MSYQVLARKWRPRTFQTIVGQEPILRMLTHALDSQRLHHAYLFTGTRGVGKTTLARLFAKCVNCEKNITSEPCGTCKNCTAIDNEQFLDLLEIDAASRTKVEDTRELLDNVQYQPTQGRYKIYLIDEVHMLSNSSFNALLKTLEEPPPYIIFLLATTDPKRLPVTILSRCLQFNLRRVSTEQIASHLQHLCREEKIAFETQALQQLALAADGSVRDALSLLDQAITYCQENITLTDIHSMLGSIEQDALFRLLETLATQEGKKLLTESAQLAEFALDFDQVLENLLSILHRVSVVQIIPDAPEENEKIKQLAKRFTEEDIQLYYQIALIGRRDLPLAPTPHQGFEMILLRMLAFKPITRDLTKATLSTAKEVPLTEKKEVKENVAVMLTTTPQEPDSSWNQMLPKLELSGMAYALASNCTLLNTTPNKITLALSTLHEPMLNKKLSDRIEQALGHYLKKPIKLEINIITNEIDSPAKQLQQEQTTRQMTATETIKNDSHVQKIIDIFDATLNLDSIKAT